MASIAKKPILLKSIISKCFILYYQDFGLNLFFKFMEFKFY
jgi:hypothetical protein